MFKKVLSTTVLGVSVFGVIAANAALPGVYVTGQFGYADTHMGSKTDFSRFVPATARDKNLSNNGLAARLALGYQFNRNFAVEAGYLQLGEKKVTLGTVPIIDSEVKLNLQQNVFDVAGKAIVPIADNFNVYGKLGLAYVTTRIEGKLKTPGLPTTVTADLNSLAQVAKRKWAPEAVAGVSYDFTPNLSANVSWTHIQPIGNNRPGNIDFYAAGFGYSFG